MGASRLLVTRSVATRSIKILKTIGLCIFAASLSACATTAPTWPQRALIPNERIADGVGIGTGLSEARIRTPKPTREPGFEPADQTPPDDMIEPEVGVFTIPFAASNPRGEVRVEVLGRTTVNLGERAPEAPPAEALRVRLKVDNFSGNDWTLDTRLQTMSVGQATGLRPTFARAEQIPPFIDIAAGQSREIELFYILPDDVTSGGASDRLQISWNLLTDRGVETEIATFRPVGQSSVSATTLAFSSDEPQTESQLQAPSEQPHATPLRGTAPSMNWWRDPFAPTPYLWRDLVY